MTRTRDGLAGLLAAGLAVGVAELTAGVLAGRRSPVVVVADAIIAATPGPIVRFAIETFGERNRLVLTVAMAVVVLVAAWYIGTTVRSRPWVAPLGFGLFAAVGAAAGLADPLVPASSAVLAPLLGALAGLAGLAWLLRGRTRPRAGHAPTPPVERDPAPDDTDPTSPPPPRRSRRDFLVGAVSVAGAAAAFGLVGRTLQGRSAVDEARLATDLPAPRSPVGAPPPGTRLDVPGLSPLVTPNGDFYRIDTAYTVPRVDPDTHRIRVTGMVDRPFELGYDELLRRADTESYVTLSCVSNEIGGDLVGNALWLGVPLADLLDQAGVQAGADQIVGRSVDGWTGGFPVEAAFDGRPALVAVGMNGEPLPLAHGFPVRLVVSGLYGYVSDTKWLAEIELTTFDDYDAYWVPRGWSRFGPIKTQSRIDVPRNGTTLPVGEVVVAGVAWADERGVSAVEVSIDDGPWEEAELADELASTSWRQWRHVWDASRGQHRLRVRASDADGTPQTADVAPPAPDGATGHHTITVTVD